MVQDMGMWYKTKYIEHGLGTRNVEYGTWSMGYGVGAWGKECGVYNVLTNLLDHQNSSPPHSRLATKVCACTLCHSYPESSGQPGNGRAPNRVSAAS